MHMSQLHLQFRQLRNAAGNKFLHNRPDPCHVLFRLLTVIPLCSTASRLGPENGCHDNSPIWLPSQHLKRHLHACRTNSRLEFGMNQLPLILGAATRIINLVLSRLFHRGCREAKAVLYWVAIGNSRARFQVLAGCLLY